MPYPGVKAFPGRLLTLAGAESTRMATSASRAVVSNNSGRLRSCPENSSKWPSVLNLFARRAEAPRGSHCDFVIARCSDLLTTPQGGANSLGTLRPRAHLIDRFFTTQWRMLSSHKNKCKFSLNSCTSPLTRTMFVCYCTNSHQPLTAQRKVTMKNQAKVTRISKGFYKVQVSGAKYRVIRPLGDDLWHIINEDTNGLDFAVSKAEALRILNYPYKPQGDVVSDKQNTPFEAFGRMYFFVGNSITCKAAYVGCPAEIIEVLSLHGADSHYRVKVDATGHPEAFDENGEPETLKFAILHHTEITE